ncbi:MAG: extracellular solute-binding protein [bacterium]|nr:extracellular solute-binding protein [bacterium]
MSSFQTIVLGIFGVFIIAGLLVIASVKSKGSGEEVAHLSMWGSVSGAEMQNMTDYFFSKSKTLALNYREIPESDLDQALLEALASGRGPDMVMLPATLLLRYRDKIVPIPYVNYTERVYRDTFVQAADLFLTPEGAAALPFSLDPLVMYWNRDFLDEAGITTPPKFWDEFLLLANKLTLKDRLGNISRSAVALGEYRNIASAKEILAALFLQSGTPIFSANASGGLRGSLNQTGAASVLDFYTEFANPLKPDYSWNRSLPNSRSAFLASSLAVYFGFGSEYNDLKRGNPNLNFDIALFPRPRNASVGLTYGKLTGISILRSSSNPSAALQVALILSSAEASSRLQQLSGLPPVHRSLLADKPTDSYGALMYDSASRARGFLDPNPRLSSGIFQTMVESVTSGKERSGGALEKANQSLEGAY